MPTYDYLCEEHGEFEYFHLTMNEEKIKSAPCPQCNKISKKIFSSGGNFLLTGTGFYSTDSKSTGSGKTQNVKTNYGKSAPVNRSK